MEIGANQCRRANKAVQRDPCKLARANVARGTLGLKITQVLPECDRGTATVARALVENRKGPAPRVERGSAASPLHVRQLHLLLHRNNRSDLRTCVPHPSAGSS
jgi:hypothetical protein